MWYHLEQTSADSTVLGFLADPKPMGQTGPAGAATLSGSPPPNPKGYFAAPECTRKNRVSIVLR